jgi:hypothetical protein
MALATSTDDGLESLHLEDSKLGSRFFRLYTSVRSVSSPRHLRAAHPPEQRLGENPELRPSGQARTALTLGR